MITTDAWLKQNAPTAAGIRTEQKSRTTYTYGLGLIGERRDDREEFYYHYNHNGSTVAVSDAGGNVLYRFTYDTYGELSDITTDDGVITDRNGLYYMRVRYYD